MLSIDTADKFCLNNIIENALYNCRYISFITCFRHAHPKLPNILSSFFPKVLCEEIVSFILIDDFVVKTSIRNGVCEIFSYKYEIHFTFNLNYNPPWTPRQNGPFYPANIKFMSYCMYSLFGINDCLNIHHDGLSYLEGNMPTRLKHVLKEYSIEKLYIILPLFVLFYDLLVLKK